MLYSKDFVWGALFPQKSWRPLFSRRPQKTVSTVKALNKPPNLYRNTPHSENDAKIDSYTLPRGALGVMRVHLQIFSANYAYFFAAL